MVYSDMENRNSAEIKNGQKIKQIAKRNANK